MIGKPVYDSAPPVYAKDVDRRPEIDEELDTLFMRLEYASSALGRLQEKLAPVLSPPGPQGEDSEKRSGTTTKLGARIREISDLASTLGDWIDGINRRVEV